MAGYAFSGNKSWALYSLRHEKKRSSNRFKRVGCAASHKHCICVKLQDWKWKGTYTSALHTREDRKRGRQSEKEFRAVTHVRAIRVVR